MVVDINGFHEDLLNFIKKPHLNEEISSLKSGIKSIFDDFGVNDSNFNIIKIATSESLLDSDSQNASSFIEAIAQKVYKINSKEKDEENEQDFIDEENANKSKNEDQEEQEKSETQEEDKTQEENQEEDENALTEEDLEEINLYGIEGITNHKQLMDFKNSEEYELIQNMMANTLSKSDSIES